MKEGATGPGDNEDAVGQEGYAVPDVAYYAKRAGNSNPDESLAEGASQRDNPFLRVSVVHDAAV
jgi:hypothetical protein